MPPTRKENVYSPDVERIASEAIEFASPMNCLRPNVQRTVAYGYAFNAVVGEEIMDQYDMEDVQRLIDRHFDAIDKSAALAQLERMRARVAAAAKEQAERSKHVTRILMRSTPG